MCSLLECWLILLLLLNRMKKSINQKTNWHMSGYFTSLIGGTVPSLFSAASHTKYKTNGSILYNNAYFTSGEQQVSSTALSGSSKLPVPATTSVAFLAPIGLAVSLHSLLLPAHSCWPPSSIRVLLQLVQLLHPEQPSVQLGKPLAA